MSPRTVIVGARVILAGDVQRLAQRRKATGVEAIEPGIKIVFCQVIILDPVKLWVTGARTVGVGDMDRRVAHPESIWLRRKGLGHAGFGGVQAGIVISAPIGDVLFFFRMRTGIGSAVGAVGVVSKRIG